MDIGFHVASSVWLAHRLGARRWKQLLLAGLIGLIPDLVAIGGGLMTDEWRASYRLAHSLTFNLPLLAVLLMLDRKIAWGAILHVSVDVLTHNYATRYLLFPFAQIYVPLGINWFQGRGWLVWAGLWALLITALIPEYRRVYGHPAGRTAAKRR